MSDDCVSMLELSGSQQAIWTGQRLQPGEPLYNMVLCFEIQGDLDPTLFQQAFQRLVDQSDALRMRIVGDATTPRQCLDGPFPYTVELVDLSNRSDPTEACECWVNAHRSRDFDAWECLFESVLLKLATDRFIWYFNQHHLSTDASTTALLFGHMQTRYRLAREGRLDDADEIPAFRDYLVQEREGRESPAYLRAQTFWQECLRTPLQPSVFYRPVPAERSGRTERVTHALGSTRSHGLKTLAGQDDFRAFTADLAHFQLFATVFFSWLYRTTGNSHLAIGTPTHNRVSPQLKATPGLFIEVFPLQVTVEPGDRFVDLHARVAAAAQQLFINTAPGVSGSGQNRAYDVLLNYITASFGDFDGLPVQSEWVHAGYGDRNHLLRIQVHDFDQADEFLLHFDMNVDAFVGTDRQQACRHFLALMDALLDDPKQAIAGVSLVDDAEQRRLVALGTAGPAQLPPGQTVVERFGIQVQRCPEATALVCGDQMMSYADLDDRVQRLASVLAGQGVGRGARVALCLPRSFDVVVAIYAVLRCGAAYVPIDPTLPADRVAFILDAAGVSSTLVVASTVNALPARAPAVLRLDELDSVAPSDRPSLPDSVKPRAGDPCYVIFTSGSTGQPKGVVIRHAGLANYIDWACRYYLRGEALDFALFSNLAFDLTVTSLFVPLLSGNRLIIYPESGDRREMTIQRVVEDNQASIIKLTPAHLALIQTLDLSASRLRKLIVGGDDLKTDLVRAVTRRFGGEVEVYNEYGPTEGTVACMIHRYDPGCDIGASVPVGRAIDGAQILLLDDHLHPVPQGVTGQIYIGGDGVAEGYLGDPEQTAQRFIANPLGDGRLYASGDLARWDDKGVMHYLGRSDHQVKIRGVRIELAEIEASLLSHPAISECAVSAVDRNDPAHDAGDEAFCRVCGISGRHPDAQLDDDRVCRICRDYEAQPDKAHGYFGTMDDLQHRVDRIRAQKTGRYDCLALLSGGKDSTYALCRLVEMGLTPLVFTLDNGYISDGAKANIRRLTDSLGLDLHVGSTPAMNEVFVDSLQRHSNVCNGCFKVIYTLSMNLARQHGIRTITTGLSRGQIFETRLADLFRHQIYDAADIDRMIIKARKAYHRLDDVISRELDTAIFADDAVFEEIQFLDFYRYCDASLDDIYDYLDRQVAWVRPADTGRSTNCLINEAGIYVHKTELGFHNYSLPYSWDVRLGHKKRDAARAELDDNIDVDNVRRILTEVGYRGEATAPVVVQDKRLVAYYVASVDPAAGELSEYLRHRLPDEMVPGQFVQMDELPLTRNGKIDRDALPDPTQQVVGAVDYLAPVGDVESRLAALWAEVIGVPQVGRDDDFFDLGGDSILNIQIVSHAKRYGLAITPQQIFDHPTVAGLAEVVGCLERVEAEQGEVVGETDLAPVQQRYFEAGTPMPEPYSQHVLLQLPTGTGPKQLQTALDRLLRQHDGLRSRFARQGDVWRQRLAPSNEAGAWPMLVIDVAGLDEAALANRVDQLGAQLQQGLDVSSGPLLGAAFLDRGRGDGDRVLLLVHHLLIDGVSWWILIEDLLAALGAGAPGAGKPLPEKTTSIPAWVAALTRFANSPACRDELDYWLGSSASRARLPRSGDGKSLSELVPMQVLRVLDAAETDDLLRRVPKAYNTQIADVMLAALSQAVNAWSGERELVLDIEGHGRDELAAGIDLMRTVGWFTNTYPVRLHCDPIQAPGQTLVAIKEQLRAVPRHGMGYGALRYLSDDQDVRDRLTGCAGRELLFNYMGRWGQGETPTDHLRLLRPIGVHVGLIERTRYLLEVNACVFDGCLRIDWSFTADKLTVATVERLADDFVSRLRGLIAHCLAQEAGGLTPSDVPDADLDQGALNDLLAEFGEDC